MRQTCFPGLFQCIFSSMIPNWIYLLALANKLPANEPEAHNKIICYARQPETETETETEKQ